jgi:hypothetical protein
MDASLFLISAKPMCNRPLPVREREETGFSKKNRPRGRDNDLDLLTLSQSD